MPLFTWKDSYSVGVEVLDQHHRKLFSIVNRLYDDCMQPDATSDVAARLAELMDYSNYHFTAEEQFMKQSGYAGKETHIRLHHAFIDKIARLRQGAADSGEELTGELIVFLGNWLLRHVMEEDRKYSLGGAEDAAKQPSG